MKIKLTLDVFMHVPDEFSSDKIPVKVIDALFREQLAVGVFDPEEAKVTAMEGFVDYIKGLAALFNKRAFLKKDIANKFTPTIGFSDDDIRNVEVMKKRFDKEKKVETVKAIYEKLGIQAIAEHKMQSYFEEAFMQLQGLEIKNEAYYQALLGITQELIHREK